MELLICMLCFSFLVIGIFYRLYVRLLSNFESDSGTLVSSMIDSAMLEPDFEISQAFFELCTDYLCGFATDFFE